jgi:hypothetical protein
MKRLVGLAAMLALVLVLSGERTSVSAVDGKRFKSIEKIMEEAHAGDNAIRKKIKGEVKEAEPKWDDIRKLSDAWVIISKDLGKNTPPKGDKKSWKKLTDQYVKDVASVDTAANKKSKDGVEKALKKLDKACTACHKLHKKEEE